MFLLALLLLSVTSVDVQASEDQLVDQVSKGVLQVVSGIKPKEANLSSDPGEFANTATAALETVLEKIRPQLMKALENGRSYLETLLNGTVKVLQNNPTFQEVHNAVFGLYENSSIHDFWVPYLKQVWLRVVHPKDSLKSANNSKGVHQNEVLKVWKQQAVAKISQAVAQVTYSEKEELDTGVFDSEFFKGNFIKDYQRGYVDIAMQKMHGLVQPLKQKFKLKMSLKHLRKLVETGIGVFVRGVAFHRALDLFRRAAFYPVFSTNKKIKDEEHLVLEISRAFRQELHQTGKTLYMKIRKQRKLASKSQQEIIKKRADKLVKDVAPKLRTLGYNIAIVFVNKAQAKDAVGPALKVMQESLKKCFHLCANTILRDLGQAFKLMGNHKRPGFSNVKTFTKRIPQLGSNSTLDTNISLIGPDLEGNSTGN